MKWFRNQPVWILSCYYIHWSIFKTLYRYCRGAMGSIHYNDVIMGAVASQITSLAIDYSTVYSHADQRKHQSSASLAFVQRIHRGPNSKMASNAENVSIWWRHHVTIWNQNKMTAISLTIFQLYFLMRKVLYFDLRALKGPIDNNLATLFHAPHIGCGGHFRSWGASCWVCDAWWPCCLGVIERDINHHYQ